ncbi:MULTISPECIES: major royal jelly family protein [unclassified Asaia]|uniref:major royal jelly family protein n=1 Tax=unclassified Asaia TaxID=2685023 RepID=UPI001F4111C0|nr:major royal jelly family protein [Asaia sp. W19]
MIPPSRTVAETGKARPSIATICGLMLTTGMLLSCPPSLARGVALNLVATSTTLDWNAVALTSGHVLVGGPRWTGFPGPSVALVTQGSRIRPFPDKEWNSWAPGQDARKRFVNVNALHVDPEGTVWVVDTGTPEFGGPPVKDGAKLVRIDASKGTILRIYPLGPEVAPVGSYVDDIRFNGPHAYLTDAGTGALLVLDLASGGVRRVLAGNPAAMAQPGRPIVVDGQVLRKGDGTPMLINADPLEVSPDGRFLYFGPLAGPWSRIPTAALDDPNLSDKELAATVEPWADIPPIGGSAMDSKGRLYFTALRDDTLYRRDPDGKITMLARDHRLHWADAPFLNKDNTLWLPVAQLDRLSRFNGGKSHIRQPFALYSVPLTP